MRVKRASGYGDTAIHYHHGSIDMSQKSLKKISRAAMMWQKGAMAPKHVLIACSATAIIITSLVMSHVLVGFLSAAIVALVLALKSNAAKTHEEHINSLLSTYEPKDKVSFKWLQDETKKAGQLQISVVLEWLKKESVAVNGENKPDPKEISFVTRKV